MVFGKPRCCRQTAAPAASRAIRRLHRAHPGCWGRQAARAGETDTRRRRAAGSRRWSRSAASRYRLLLPRMVARSQRRVGTSRRRPANLGTKPAARRACGQTVVGRRAADQARADQTRADQARADQTRADQARADQARAAQARAAQPPAARNHCSLRAETSSRQDTARREIPATMPRRGTAGRREMVERQVSPRMEHRPVWPAVPGQSAGRPARQPTQGRRRHSPAGVPGQG